MWLGAILFLCGGFTDGKRQLHTPTPANVGRASVAKSCPLIQGVPRWRERLCRPPVGRFSCPPDEVLLPHGTNLICSFYASGPRGERDDTRGRPWEAQHGPVPRLVLRVNALSQQRAIQQTLCPFSSCPSFCLSFLSICRPG